MLPGEHSFVSPEDVEVFSRIGTIVDMPRHTTLHRAGAISGSCYHILEGQVEPFDSIASGNERIFRRSGPGARTLLPAMMIRHELHLSFRTSCPTRVIKISGDQLQGYFLATPDLAARTVQAVSGLYIEMMEQYWALKDLGLSWRLCSLLLDMAEQCVADTTAPAVANAIHMATGIYINELPLDRERIWRMVRDQKKARSPRSKHHFRSRSRSRGAGFI